MCGCTGGSNEKLADHKRFPEKVIKYFLPLLDDLNKMVIILVLDKENNFSKIHHNRFIINVKVDKKTNSFHDKVTEPFFTNKSCNNVEQHSHDTMMLACPISF